MYKRIDPDDENSNFGLEKYHALHNHPLEYKRWLSKANIFSLLYSHDSVDSIQQLFDSHH